MGPRPEPLPRARSTALLLLVVLAISGAYRAAEPTHPQPWVAPAERHLSYPHWTLAGPSKPAKKQRSVHEMVEATIDQGRTSVYAAIGRAADYARLDRGLPALAQAREALRIEPLRAVELAHRILEVPQAEDLRNRAIWVAALGLMRQGQTEAALDAFNEVGSTPVDDYLQLHRIEALLAIQQPAVALRIADDLVERLEGGHHPTLHHAYELRLTALFEGRLWTRLAVDGAAFLDRYPEYPRQDRVRVWLGQAQLHLGNPTAAADWFDQVLWTYPYRPTAHVALWALRVLAGMGVDLPRHSWTERFERARQLRINKHWSVAHTALSDLMDDVLARDGETGFVNEIRMELWRNAYGADNYQLALTYLEDILHNESRGIRDWTLWSNLSETYARLGRYQDGVQAIRRRDRGRSTAHIHAELAEYYLENGFYRQSLEHSRQYLSDRRQQRWDFSLLLFLAGEYEQAARHFEVLAERGSPSVEPRYRYWQARALKEAGHQLEAREWFSQVRQRWPRSYYGLQADNRLWEMDQQESVRIAEAGDWDSSVSPAETAESSLHSGSPPPSTLQELAGNLIRDLNLTLTGFVRREVPQVSFRRVDNPSDSAVRSARIHWDGPNGLPDSYFPYLAANSGITTAYLEQPREEALFDLARNYGHLFGELERAAFLWSVGEAREAYVEARGASLEFHALDRYFQRRRPRLRRPVDLPHRRFAHFIDRRSDETGFWGIDLDSPRYPVPAARSDLEAFVARQQAIYDQRFEMREAFEEGLMVLEDYHMVRRFARTRIDWSSSPLDEEELDDWSRVFPRAYPQQVEAHAQRWQVNPYIMWSLMTVESAFNPDSISRSNARGLLQVIPKTGELIAQRLSIFDFGPHNLMNPETSIEFGCYYFSELMTKFQGQELLAFAAYNGGPHNVARWLEGRGDLPLDAFIETIPFDQAREYTKKVFRYLALYRSIYLGETSLYVGQQLDPHYRSNIHF